jgi:hypothetical protein
MAKTEDSLFNEIVERARMEGQRLGRAPFKIDREARVRDRLAGMSLTSVAKKYGVSRASVVRFVSEMHQRQASRTSRGKPARALEVGIVYLVGETVWIDSMPLARAGSFGDLPQIGSRAILEAIGRQGNRHRHRHRAHRVSFGRISYKPAKQSVHLPCRPLHLATEGSRRDVCRGCTFPSGAQKSPGWPLSLSRCLRSTDQSRELSRFNRRLPTLPGKQLSSNRLRPIRPHFCEH